jgi:PII-like signaling protein
MNPGLRRHHRPEGTPEHPVGRPPLHGPALRLTVYVGESDQAHHRPLYAELVHRAHRAGLAGASVFRGIEGYGATALVHTSRLLDLAEDLPVAVVVVDEEQRIRDFLPQVREAAPEALITLDPVQVVGPAVPPGGDREDAR